MENGRAARLDDAQAALVLCDHALFRRGISSLLRRECGFAQVFEAETLSEAFQALGDNPVISFASFDLGVSGVNNVQSLVSIRKGFPWVRIAVASGSVTRDHVLMTLHAGVHGYIPYSFNVPEITDAFRMILAGGIFVPPLVAELPASYVFPHPSWRASAEEPGLPLTARQQDVLRLIRAGSSNKQIALALGLSENTVKVHANGLFRALGVKTRAEAARAPDQD